KTNDALMNVTNVPSQGFTSSQLRNVGTLGNKGIELQVDAGVVQGSDWGLDLGLGVTTNNSKVIDMGGIPEFNALGGRIIEGQPVPVNYARRVANPDGVDGAWEYGDGGADQIIGPQLPTHFITPSLSLRTPGNIQITARGEYRGGNMMEVN